MPSKTIKSALLTCCLFSIHAAQAQVYIINTQTLDPEQLGTGGGHSLSDVKANRAVQLEYYHYSERQDAVANRRQTIMNLAQQIDTLAQSGTDQQTLTLLDGQIRQLQAATQESLAFLSPFTLPEFKQLYQAEQENAALLTALQQKSAALSAAAPSPRPSEPASLPGD